MLTGVVTFTDTNGIDAYVADAMIIRGVNAYGLVFSRTTPKHFPIKHALAVAHRLLFLEAANVCINGVRVFL